MATSHIRLALIDPKLSTHAHATQGGADDGPLPLTLEHVELVLDEMRPYLMSDG